MVYVDTNILIYLLEGKEWSHPIADKLTALSLPLKTSALTITEFLSGAINFEDARASLYQMPSLVFIKVNEPIAERAADLQKNHGLKIGDALHLATAIEGDCTYFFTNDLKLAKAAGKYLAVLKP